MTTRELIGTAGEQRHPGGNGTEFVQAEQVDLAVAVEYAGELAFVDGFDQFVDQVRGGGVADLEAGLGESRCRCR